MKKLLLTVLALAGLFAVAHSNCVIDKSGQIGISTSSVTRPGEDGSGEEVIPGSHGGGIQKYGGYYKIVQVTGMGRAQDDLNFVLNKSAASLKLDGSKNPGGIESLYAICQNQKCVLRPSASGNFVLKQAIPGQHGFSDAQAGSIGTVSTGLMGTDVFIHVK